MAQVRNLVIDLGGVLYAIDVNRAISSFMRLHRPEASVKPDVWIQRHQFMFDRLEAGLIAPGDFRGYLREEGDLAGNDSEIDAAWNALLGGPIAGRAEDLRMLQEKYRLILLSNTNIIHQEFLRPQCTDLFTPFERLFFSYDMGIRKPDPEIYRMALGEMGMEAGESLFIDDNLQNVEGARRAGLAGQHVEAHSDAAWRQLVDRLLS